MLLTKKPIIAAAIITFAPCTQAQTNPDLQPVTIYGSRFQETIDKALPQTTIITSSQIEKSGLTNVSEILQKIAGVVVRNDLNGGNNGTIDLRGYGDTAQNNVVVLIDGIRLSEYEQTVSRTSIIPTEAIDHIEINRGGNSVLYGDGATSGYINIITKSPNQNLTVTSIGAGSFNTYTTNLYTSSKINDLSISVFGQTNNTSGYRQNSQGDSQSAGTTLEWSPNKNIKSGVRIFKDLQNNNQPGALPIAWLQSNPKNKQTPDYVSNNWIESQNITIYQSIKNGDVEYSLNINTRNKENKSNYSKDKSQIVDMTYGCSSYCWYTTSQSFGNITAKSNTTQISPKIKHSDFLIKDHQLIYGMDLGYWKIDRQSYADDDTGSSITHDTQRTRSGYIQSDWKIDRANRLTTGYRTENLNQTHGYNWIGVQDYGSVSTRKNINAYELQYSTRFTSNISGFAKIGDSYRLPNTNDNHNMIYVMYDSKPLNPQTSHDKEIGISAKESNYVVNFRAFQSNITNEIYFSNGSNINLDKTLRKGVEIDGNYKFINSYVIRLAAQMIEAHFKSGTNNGKNIPTVPNLNATLSITKSFNTFDSATLSARYSGSSYAAEDNSNSQPKTSAYTLFDARYNTKYQNWEFVASVNNLFDRRYYDYAVYKPEPYLAAYQYTVYPSAPRNFSILGRYVF